MNMELQEKLFEKYPKIFKQKDLPMTQTAMCWGIECGNGWYKIIDYLCDSIQSYIDSNGKIQTEASQIKEKFGELRFYADYSSETVDGMIWLAETMSLKTCERCGSIENVSQTNTGWIKTLCEKCMDKRKRQKD